MNEELTKRERDWLLSMPPWSDGTAGRKILEKFDRLHRPPAVVRHLVIRDAAERDLARWQLAEDTSFHVVLLPEDTEQLASIAVILEQHEDAQVTPTGGQGGHPSPGDTP